MKPSLLLFLIWFAWGFRAHAQVMTLTGAVTDSSQAPIAGATVVLLRQADSVLASFGSTHASGQFSLRRVQPGSYVLQISLTGYSSYRAPLALAAGTTTFNLPPVVLYPTDYTLGTVDIEAEQSPILFKKDTLEYNTGAFPTQPNASVEDLLKKLPGIEVDADGTVKAQGETVQRVLVDGKEFFGQDPKIATRNLQAEAVKKVQVFDKKSDAAEFTGIDDGQREKTINLELKEDRKKGTFGNVSGGYGTADRFTFKGNVNRFRPGLQLSGIGMLNNVNQQGFTFQDYFQMMGGMRSIGGGRAIIRLDGSDANATGLPLTNSSASGFVTTGSGGLNLNYDISPKTSLSTSYFASGVQRIEDETVYREQIAGTSPFTTDEHNTQDNRWYNHRLTSTLRHEDSVQQLTLRLRLGWNETDRTSLSDRTVTSPEGLLQNTSSTTQTQTGTRGDGQLSLNYQRKLSSNGRNIGVEGTLEGLFNRQAVDYTALNTLYPKSGSAITDSLHQDQSQEEEQLVYGATVTYTEPLKKWGYLQLSYGYEQTEDVVDRQVYDLIPDRTLNTSLTNIYERLYAYQRTGASVYRSRGKNTWRAGTYLQRSDLTGDLISLQDTISRQFTNILPSLSYTRQFANTHELEVEYTTRVNEPSLTQLQPVIDNSDPLNLYAGNPELRPEYAHNLRVNHHLFDQFSFMSLFSMLQVTYTEHKIVEATTIDSLFRQIRTPVNVDQDVQVTGFSSFSTPVRPLKIRLSLNANATYNRGIAYVNAVDNTVNRLTASGTLQADNRKKDKVDLSGGVTLSLSRAAYSTSTTANRTFVNQQYFADAVLRPYPNWSLRSRLSWNIYGGQTFEANPSVALLSAGVTRYLYKQRIALELSGNDLLNQNQGISREASLTYVEETRTVSLARYFMLTLTYNLAGANADKGPRMMMVRPM
ncbi:MAG: TonB-dependent receptor [Bacteroidia bacterium]|nr:TonB-dependent receptor [Bacteroidia bacterium]